MFILRFLSCQREGTVENVQEKINNRMDYLQSTEQANSSHTLG